jgi:dUTP pyrophosphatase
MKDVILGGENDLVFKERMEEIEQMNKSEMDMKILDNNIQNAVYVISKEQIERVEFEEWKACQTPKENDIALFNDKQFIFKNNEYLRLDEVQGNSLFFAKVRETAKIPTKESENMGYDIYADFEEEYMLIYPHETKMIPTGICSACSEDYAIVLKERGSTGTKGMGQRCGVIDSGYRGEWFVPITNTTNYPLIISKINDETELLTKAYGKIAPVGTIIYPYTKGICQAVVLPVPKMNVQEISLDVLKSIPSKRKDGKIGSSGK